MTASEAQVEFNRMFASRPHWTCPFPENKQKGPMKQPAYLTGLVNMILEANLGGRSVN
ncbi:DUF7687 domain-containing protein [Deinococcus cavernae]|uniref:DUF7687 domain-containing protein n=1 Tax=Deinococcus cavernae TaxID=2320857 RepID=UPI001314DCAE|nr:hypothetical protein [Deinococcus cavernae]